MNNTKKGSLLCILASTLSFSTVFLWLGKIFKIKLSTNNYYDDDATTIYKKVYEFLESPLDNIYALFLIGGVIISLVALYKAYKGFEKNDNKCSTVTALLLINIITIVLLCILRKDIANSYDTYGNYNKVKVEFATNMVFLIIMLATSIVLSFVGTVLSNAKEKTNNSVEKKLKEYKSLLENEIISEKEYEELRKKILNDSTN